MGLAQLWQRGALSAGLLVYLPSMTRSPTKPACHSNMVLEHYRRVVGSLTFGYSRDSRQVRVTGHCVSGTRGKERRPDEAGF
jgi:hypothetical protein